MSSDPVRHTRSAAKTNPSLLDGPLSYLKGLNYLAVVEPSKNGSNRWTVEFDAGELKRLLEPYQRLAEAQVEIKSMTAMIQAKDAKIEEQTRALEAWQAKYAAMLKNVEEHYVEKRHVKSPKNYLAVAKERATNLASPPLQGGSAGLEKK